MRHAVINKDTKKVTNVIVWNGDSWTPPANHFVVRSDECDINDTWDEVNKKFIKTRK